MTPLIVVGSNTVSSARNCCGIATAADHGHAGPGRDAGLLHQTGHNQYRPRINSIARGRVVPRPQIHIPTPTTLLLVFLRFRYRANAQSGKNFG